jgi:tetratricopeptide (TPR) repeat protein
MKQLFFIFFFIISSFLISSFFFSCASVETAEPIHTPLNPAHSIYSSWTNRNAPGLSGEARALIEDGGPASLARVLSLIKENNLAETDWGRETSFVCASLLQKVYPDYKTLDGAPIAFSKAAPLLTHVYTRLVRMQKVADWEIPKDDSVAMVLKCLPILDSARQAELTNDGEVADVAEDVDPHALLDYAEQAARLNSGGSLAYFFAGLCNEQIGDYPAAAASYQRALDAAPDCYPAAIGNARIFAIKGDTDKAETALETILAEHPNNVDAQMLLALVYYSRGNYEAAAPLIDSAIAARPILGQSNRGAPLFLIKASILVERGAWREAGQALDAYALFDSNNADYLLLRGEYYAEGTGDTAAALVCFRKIIAKTPTPSSVPLAGRNLPLSGLYLPAAPTEAVRNKARYYVAKILLASENGDEKKEGSALLWELLGDESHWDEADPDVLSLAVEDAISQKNWTQAETLNEQLLSGERSKAALSTGITIANALGDTARALSLARELYTIQPDDPNSQLALVQAAEAAGLRQEALSRIGEFLSQSSTNAVRSRLYFERSLLQSKESDAMDDLRTSQYLNPRNIDTLAALFNYYHTKKDSFRALHYLRQVAALEPENQLIKRYGKEYGIEGA